MDIKSPKTGIVKRSSVFRKKHAIRCQRDILQLLVCCQSLHKFSKTRPQKWLASRDADLRDPKSLGHGHKAKDLFERKELRCGSKVSARFRHAIEAPDVTSIGYANPQIVVHPAKLVRQQAMRQCGFRKKTLRR
jgi:hypothetical protein